MASNTNFLLYTYRGFHGFGQAQFPDGGLILDLRQFSVLPQLPQKPMLGFKGVKIDSKISNSRRESKSATHSSFKTFQTDELRTKFSIFRSLQHE
jgi:hypothetical protein